MNECPEVEIWFTDAGKKTGLAKTFNYHGKVVTMETNAKLHDSVY